MQIRTAMKSALSYAKHGIGISGKNPSVGCIILNSDMDLVSLGRTGFNGRPHAEKIALESLKSDITGGVAVITLEPCAHENKNGSCASLLAKSGIKKISGDGYTTKCVRQWDCTSDWIGRKQNAGLSSGYFVDHARAELNTPNNRSGYIRNDQWKNFEKAGYPERPGITNIREKGAQMRIATFLGQDCDGGNFSNSGGSYLIYDFTWP